MQNLGMIPPGNRIKFSFSTFDSNLASVTMTGLTAADVIVYKDNGVSFEARTSTAGINVSTDFGSRTGLHYVDIQTTDNTDTGFYVPGFRYHVIIDSVVVDTQTVRFIAGTFELGQRGAFLNTYVNSLTSQTVFTLPAAAISGVAEGEMIGCKALFSDLTSGFATFGWATIQDFTTATNTITLEAAPAITIASSDCISVYPPARNTGDTYALLNSADSEPAQGTPVHTASLAVKIATIFKFLVNKKTATSTELAVYNSVTETTVDHKSTISEVTGTYTEGEWISGP